MGKSLKLLMLITDIGFLVYWTIVFWGVLPKEYLYKDYNDELMVAWNLSFIPLDLIITFTGLISLLLYRKHSRAWIPLTILSLSLTFCSGLQAIAFWAIRGDFDIWWWIPNLFLLFYPLFFLPKLIRLVHEPIQEARAV